MSDFNQLLLLARRKHTFDQHHTWSQGAHTYLHSLPDELAEALHELALGRTCYLEEELGDILWVYLNALLALESEQGISLEKVLVRAVQKFTERMQVIEAGGSWDAVKQQQKARLAAEYQAAQQAKDE